MINKPQIHLVEMRFMGHRKVVEFALFGYDDGIRCRIRLAWSDENVEYWLLHKADRWNFQNKVVIPKEILAEAATFDRLIKLFQNGSSKI